MELLGKNFGERGFANANGPFDNDVAGRLERWAGHGWGL